MRQPEITAATGEGWATTAGPVRPSRGGMSWWKIFLIGLALWAATVVVTFVTHNANLVPTIILLGSFLVPVTFVSFAFRRADEVITAQRIFTAFIGGGVLGVLGASLLEAEFLRNPSVVGLLGVGLVEEAAKLAALWLLARRLPRYGVRDGMVLGAAVGFGFAALESAGYAFNAMFSGRGLSLVSLVETELLRAVLAPVGHGLWTAILGGALFATAAGRRRPRLRWTLLWWYLLVSLLHALWDATGPIAVFLTLVLTGSPAQWLAVQLGQVPTVAQTQVHLYTVLNWSLLAFDALIGLLVLFARSRASGPSHRRQRTFGASGGGASAPGPLPGPVGFDPARQVQPYPVPPAAVPSHVASNVHSAPMVVSLMDKCRPTRSAIDATVEQVRGPARFGLGGPMTRARTATGGLPRAPDRVGEVRPTPGPAAGVDPGR